MNNHQELGVNRQSCNHWVDSYRETGCRTNCERERSTRIDGRKMPFLQATHKHHIRHMKSVKIPMFDWCISPCWLPVLMPYPPSFQLLQNILEPSSLGKWFTLTVEFPHLRENVLEGISHCTPIFPCVYRPVWLVLLNHDILLYLVSNNFRFTAMIFQYMPMKLLPTIPLFFSWARILCVMFRSQVHAMAGSSSSLVREHCHFSLPEACIDCAGGAKLIGDVPWWMINFYV